MEDGGDDDEDAGGAGGDKRAIAQTKKTIQGHVKFLGIQPHAVMVARWGCGEMI